MSSTDISTLGRIGQPLRGGPRRRRRRSQLPRIVRPVLLAALVAVVALAVTADRQVSEPAAPMAAVPDRPAGQEVSRGAQRAGTGTVFAHVEGLDLALPAQAGVIAYSEADIPEALPLEPVGRLAGNDNPDGFAPPADAAGPDYLVLAARGEGRPATGAVDLALPAEAPVAAVVDGRVTEVAEYPRAGGTRDWRVTVQPDGRPDLAVVVTFLHNPRVSVGERVRSGRTKLGVARALPYGSALAALAPDAGAQVRLRVTPAVTVEQVDPNAPASAAAEGPAGAGP